MEAQLRGASAPHLGDVWVSVDLGQRDSRVICSNLRYSVRHKNRAIINCLVLTDRMTVFSWWRKRILKQSLKWDFPGFNG